MLYNYITLFFIYSVVGWIIEVTLTLITDHKFVNRGFLIGPYTPIYGVGMIGLIICLSKIHNIFLLFLVTFILCTALEFFTSLILEKLFKLKWWDYKQFTFNFKGRVCLETMIPFTIAGVLIVEYVNPLIVRLINKVPLKILIIIDLILLTIFIIDVIISNVFMKKMDLSTSDNDDTAEIKKKMKKDIEKNVKKHIKKNHD